MSVVRDNQRTRLNLGYLLQRIGRVVEYGDLIENEFPGREEECHRILSPAEIAVLHTRNLITDIQRAREIAGTLQSDETVGDAECILLQLYDEIGDAGEYARRVLVWSDCEENVIRSLQKELTEAHEEYGRSLRNVAARLIVQANRETSGDTLGQREIEPLSRPESLLTVCAAPHVHATSHEDAGVAQKMVAASDADKGPVMEHDDLPTCEREHREAQEADVPQERWIEAEYLDLLYNERRCLIKRRGNRNEVNLSNHPAQWHTFRVFVAAGGGEAPLEVWRSDYPGKWTGHRQTVAALRDELIPLGVTVEKGKRRLIDAS